MGMASIHIDLKVWRSFLGLLLAAVLWGLSGPSLADIAPPRTDQPTVVRVYLYLDDINDIKLTTGTYNVTAQLILKWRDPRLAFASSDQGAKGPKVWMGTRAERYLETIWHPTLDISGEKGLSANTIHSLSVYPDGLVSLRQKFTTSPRFAGELEYFPFGRLNLDLTISSVIMDETQLAFELGELRPREDLARVDAVLHGNWDPLKVQWSTGSVALPDKPSRKLPQINVRIQVEHDFVDGVHKILLPLLIIGLASCGLLWMNFLVQPAFSSPRIAGTVTLILTTIALKFALNNELPVLHYLTLSDVMFNTTIIMLSFAMLASCAVAALFTDGHHGYAQRINRWLRLVYPVLYVVVLLVSCLVLL